MARPEAACCACGTTNPSGSWEEEEEEPQGEEGLCQEPRQEDVEHVQRSADLGQRRVVKEEVVKSPESAGAGSMGSTLRTGTVNQQLAPLGILNLRK